MQNKQPRKNARSVNAIADMSGEDRFRALIQQSSDAIQLVSPDGIILYSSDSVTNVLGYAPDEINGEPVEPYVHPDDWSTFGSEWQALLKKDKAILTLEYRVKHKDGSWVWIETKLTNHLHTPNIEAILGNFRNISERKKAESRLKKSEEQLRFMAESMPQKIFTSQPDGTTDYYNPQWTEYTGIPLERLLGWGWESVLHPEDVHDSRERWQFSLETGEPFSIEQRLKRHDGMFRWHICRARPMCDGSGSVTKWFGSCTDIHDTKLSLEREHELSIRAISLAKQREKLIALNESKDEFISLASHQLRTPATVVKQYLNLMLEGYAGSITPQLEDMLHKANLSNERQLDIVDDLLRVARLDAGKVKLVKTLTNIVPLVQEVINSHLAIFEERSQSVSLDYTQPGISSLLDRARMKMVIENLVDNASKYTPEGKKVHVTVSQDANGVSIVIRDEGVGIDPTDISKLFHKFTRLDNPLSVRVGGTGLGLYWAKRIVSLHGGTIEVKSKPGEGSEFLIVLPRG